MQKWPEIHLLRKKENGVSWGIILNQFIILFENRIQND